MCVFGSRHEQGVINRELFIYLDKIGNCLSRTLNDDISNQNLPDLLLFLIINK